MSRVYKKECESTCEYTLPDYMGDVKKILTVSCTPLPSGKFATEGELNFSGVVSYDILYADSEGKLTRINTSSDYDVSLPIDADTYVDSMADAKISNLTVRLTGPRKLIAKAAVTNNIRLSSEESVSTQGTAFGEGMLPETQSKNIKVENMIFMTSPEREYADEAERLPGTAADDVEIITTSGAVRILETEALDGAIRVKGELIITSIVRTEEQPPFAIRKTVPFEETIDFSGLSSDMQILADGYLTSVTSGVADDTDGCTVTVNAICEFVCAAAINSEISVITDAYLKDRDTDGVYEDYSYTELVCMGNCEESFSASVARSDIGCEEIRDVLTLSAEIRAVQKKVSQNGFEISAEAAFSGVACNINENNQVQYLPVKFTTPISVNVNCGCHIPENATLECTITPVEVQCGLDADKLSVKCALKIGYGISDTHTLRRMTECNTAGDAQYVSSSSYITVYYPEENESLFEIAKRFHTTRAKIASDNNLSESVLASSDTNLALGVKKLIIR